MKKSVSVFLAAIIALLQLAAVIPAISVPASAEDTDYKCGDNITWSLDTETGIFEVTGTGVTYSYAYNAQPWSDRRELVKKIVIGEGITILSGGFLSSFTKAETLVLPSTLTRVGTGSANYMIKEIIIPENNSLEYFDVDNIKNMAVYSSTSVAKGTPVYAGNVLCTIKSTVPSGTTVEIKEGTKYVMPEAFLNASGVTDIIFPDSLVYIGKDAFKGTTWYDNLPDGINYAGKVLFECKNQSMPDGTEITLKEGTTGIAAYAFNNNRKITGITIPATVETIGERAFFCCTNLEYADIPQDSKLHCIESEAFRNCYKLKEIYIGPGVSVLPYGVFCYTALENFEIKETLLEIGRQALSSTCLTEVYIPAHVKVAENAFSDCAYVKKFTVDPEHPDLMSDEYGAVYSKDKKTLYYVPSMIEPSEYTLAETTERLAASAFSGTEVKKIVFNSGLKTIDEYALSAAGVEILDLGSGIDALPDRFIMNSYSLNFIEVPDNIKSLGSGALCIHVSEAVFYTKDAVFGDNVIMAVKGYEPTVYCYKNSTAHIYAVEEGYPYVYISDDNKGDYTKVEYAVNKAKSINKSKYDAGWFDILDESVRTIVWDIDASYQSTIDAFATELDEIFAQMGVTWSDFSSVDAAMERVNSVDRSIYSAESLQKLDETVAYVNSQRHCDVADSTLVNLYAYQINDAVDSLEAVIGDYSAVKEAVSAANEINRSIYTEDSLAKLDEVIASINWESDDESLIASYEQAIYAAIEVLELLPADYSSLELLKEKCNSVDRSLYTDESLERLDAALGAVDESLKIDKQEQVAEYADAIQQAYDALEYLPADYSLVEEAKGRASKLDRRYYSEVSLVLLDNLIASVDYSLNITEQEKVNGYAESINDAIDSLVYAAITLRHEPCGVIVSATTKEIKPDTVLAVEEVDSSTYEGTNFAVGGSIRSLHFYDINLVLGTQTVQPEGTVTVKIKIADGVDPKKCKVYHVTDDLVNPLVRFANTIDGNYVVFETDHFSEFAVIEVEAVLDSVEVTSLPSKSVYGIGEMLDSSGLAVKAVFSDGTSKEVTDFTVGMVKLDSVGKQKVSVYYTYNGITKAAEFEVTVNAENISVDILNAGQSVSRVEKKIGIFSLYSRTKIKLDASVKNADGCRIEWSSDNAKVIVDANGNLSFKGLFGAKKAVITVKVIDAKGNVVASDSVTVIVYKLSSQLSKYQAQAVDLINRTAVMLKQI